MAVNMENIADSQDNVIDLSNESARLIKTVHPADAMNRYAPEYYFNAGAIALRNIKLAMLNARMSSSAPAVPRRVLDLPSGYGRILRWLVSAFPTAEVVACDIQSAAVDFCVETFGVKGTVGKENPDEIAVEGPFDIIWCGSLLTHVDAVSWDKFLRLFERVLRPGGVAVFTTFGRMGVDRRLRKMRNTFSLSPAQVKTVLAEYDESGYGFCDSLSQKAGAYRSGWGDCFVSPAWVCNALAKSSSKLSLLFYNESGWGPKRNEFAQDIIACVKLPG
jgi:SAM-dependent methyltransferase